MSMIVIFGGCVCGGGKCPARVTYKHRYDFISVRCLRPVRLCLHAYIQVCTRANCWNSPPGLMLTSSLMYFIIVLNGLLLLLLLLLVQYTNLMASFPRQPR